MDEKTEKTAEQLIDLIRVSLEAMSNKLNMRIDHMKKVMGDYLELSSSLSLASVKANLKSV